ncbi:MAG: hypothetical protein RLT05_01010 [Bauldia litoralis]
MISSLRLGHPVGPGFENAAEDIVMLGAALETNGYVASFAETTDFQSLHLTNGGWLDG